jgi:hypothetical protein
MSSTSTTTTTTQLTLVYSVRKPSATNTVKIQLRLDTDAQTFELSNQDGFVIQGRTEQTAPNMISLIGRIDGELPMHDLPLFRLITIGDSIKFDKGTMEDLDIIMGGFSFNSHNEYSHILMRCYMHENTAAAEAMSKFPAVAHLL